MNEVLIVHSTFRVTTAEGRVIDSSPNAFLSVVRKINIFLTEKAKIDENFKVGFTVVFKTVKLKLSEDGLTGIDNFTQERYVKKELYEHVYWMREKDNQAFEPLEDSFATFHYLCFYINAFKETTYDYVFSHLTKQLEQDFPESTFTLSVTPNEGREAPTVTFIESEKPEDPIDDPDNYDEEGNYTPPDDSDGL